MKVVIVDKKDMIKTISIKKTDGGHIVELSLKKESIYEVGSFILDNSIGFEGHEIGESDNWFDIEISEDIMVDAYLIASSQTENKITWTVLTYYEYSEVLFEYTDGKYYYNVR